MTKTNYALWAEANREPAAEGLEARAFPRRRLTLTPDPREDYPLGDWAWAEWVQEQGIGE